MKGFNKVRAALLVTAAFATTPSLAQAGSAAPTDAPSAAGVSAPSAEETADTADIVVTAQRRAQNLQNVPLAVTAISAETAQNLGIRNVVDVAAITPGASFGTGASGFFQAYIRGIGAATVSVGSEMPVAIYEDGAYMVRTMNLYEVLDNFDIANIQVLRGPQGTLYGRNATGGVIIVNSADPTDAFEGRFRGEFGNIEHRRLDGMVNLPLGEDLALRVTGSYRHEGGYIKNLSAPDAEIGGGRSYNARFKLRWQPEGADIILGGQYQNTRYLHDIDISDSQAPICFGCTLTGQANPTGYFTYNKTPLPPITSKAWGANLNMTFDLGEFDLNSTTTYRHQDNRNSASDSDYSSADLLVFTVPKSGGSTFTQDFQLTSKLSGPLNYIFGLNYLYDKGIFNPVFVGSFFPPQNGQLPGFANTAKTKSYSAYAEGYYDLTDQLKVTVGGRYTYQERRLYGDTNAAFGAIVGTGPFTFVERGSERAFTPRFVLAWDDGPTNIYYSFTRGYKAGGFAGPALFPVAEIKPEKIFSHEIGIKQRAFGGKATFNAAVFYFKNKNQQTQTYDLNAGGTVTKNAGALENYGIEAEAQLTPMNGLHLGFSGAWQHARYKPFQGAAIVCYDPTAPAGGPVLSNCSTILTGRAPPQAPEWKGSANIAYDFNIASWTANLSALAEYRSSIDFYPGAGGNLNHDRDPGRVLVNASGYISPPGANLRIGFYANNVFNKKYWISAFTNAPYGTAYEPALPRTYGVRIEYKF
ncbi:TonB-dependent receptor [Rhizorhabdus argentea]|uniref:TonB-dependent receptor n=1 Tax=Rhizorhabdus argentea TaxID=1387174 RepID=UPI0030ECCA60